MVGKSNESFRSGVMGKGGQVMLYGATQPEKKKLKFYVRATGTNQLGAGTDKWLRIRRFVKDGDIYEIKVRIRDRAKYVNASEEHSKHLEFAEGWPGLKPVSLRTVINYYNKER